MHPAVVPFVDVVDEGNPPPPPKSDHADERATTAGRAR
jgi:hypothetical protein